MFDEVLVRMECNQDKVLSFNQQHHASATMPMQNTRKTVVEGVQATIHTFSEFTFQVVPDYVVEIQVQLRASLHLPALPPRLRPMRSVRSPRTASQYLHG